MASQVNITPKDHRVRTESILSIRSFAQDVEIQKADNQLVHCLEGAMKEEEQQLKGRLVDFYEIDEFNPVPDSPDIEEQYKLLDDEYTKFLQGEMEGGKGEQLQRTTKKKRWGGLNTILGKTKDENELIKQDTKELNQKSEIRRLDGEEKSSTNIEDVKKAVLHAQEEWKSKPRMLNNKAQIQFHKFCRTLNNHSSLFSMLPDQDRYFSIFCGSVKVLIKASVNHCKIADDLAESLCRISADIDLCVDTLKVWPMNDMKKAVGQLYSYIFHFLRCAMKWYQSKAWKKVLDAFNENFLASFDSTLSSIETLKTRIHYMGALKSQAELKDIHAFIKDDAKRQREARLAEKQMWYSRDPKMEERIKGHFLQLFREIGLSMEALLDSNFQAAKHPGHTIVRRPTLPGNPVQNSESKQKSLLAKRKYTRDTLQRWSRHLEDSMMTETDLMDTREVSADNSVAVALEEWSQAMTSRTLWIRGHDEHVYPSSTSKIAATVASKALKLEIPLLAFFCDCRAPQEYSDNDVFLSGEDWEALKESVVINFLYTLIRQVISLLPSRFETRNKFSKSTFRKLDGTLTTWNNALNMLKKLMKLTPQALLVVIDGIENLDQSGLDEYVDDILTLLLSHAGEGRSDNKRVFKVLFTTAGACSSLEKLDDVDMVSPSPARSRRIYGRGRRFLDFVF